MNQYRLEGMYYAYTKIQKVGMDEFAKELAWRSPRGCAITNTKIEVKQYEQDIIRRVQDVAMIFAMAVLVDEFDFGNEELDRFRERLLLKCSCLEENYLTWDEQKQILKDECGIEVDFRKGSDIDPKK